MRPRAGPPTGAHDGTVAFPGNDLPGVMSARAGALLAQHGIAIGDRVALFGGGVYAKAFRTPPRTRRSARRYHRALPSQHMVGGASPRSPFAPPMLRALPQGDRSPETRRRCAPRRGTRGAIVRARRASRSECQLRPRSRRLCSDARRQRPSAPRRVVRWRASGHRNFARCNREAGRSSSRRCSSVPLSLNLR